MKIFKQYKEKVDLLLDKLIDTHDNKYLQKMLHHALDGGKRLRAVIVLIVNDSFQNDINLNKSALAIELIHNASLILDDMPCMDNDNYRRGKKTIHYEYGVQKAHYLASYIMALGFKLLYENYTELKQYNSINPSIYSEIIRVINKNLGYLGIATGQFIDLCPINTHIDKDNYKKYFTLDGIIELIHMKTTTLFEIAFVCPYLYNFGNTDNLELLVKTIKCFGLAFQISDDAEDMEQDMERIGDNEENINPNIFIRYGLQQGITLYKNNVRSFFENLDKLKVNKVVFTEIFELLQKRMDPLERHS